MKENELFSFIWTGLAALIASDSTFVDTGGELSDTGWNPWIYAADLDERLGVL